MSTNLKRPRQRNCVGAAALELAVCLPIIVLLVMSTIEACNMIFLKQSLTVASYEGARVAVDSPDTVAADVEAVCNQILLDRSVNGANIVIDPVNFETLAPGAYVDVTITAPANTNSVVPLKSFLGKTITGKTSMMIEY